ncbi:DinB family protein [Bacillus massilinigeriensis]|uniref:DinB family protein n=1 Tax=Bacillus mediterraneensis TaxID=1805474 RepID=UPI00135653B6
MEHNHKVREEILQSVMGLSDSELNVKPSAEKWSIMQVLEHLNLVERFVLKQVEKVMASDKETNTDAKPIHLSTDRKRKISAPSILEPTEQFITLAEMKEKLHASRNSLEAFVAGADKGKMLQRSFLHPAFGDLNVKQWIEFIGWHEKRHLEQIEEIKQELEQEEG